MPLTFCMTCGTFDGFWLLATFFLIIEEDFLDFENMLNINEIISST
jgi:hypothetical protein